MSNHLHEYVYGVPQGSVLGPCHTKCHLYVSDPDSLIARVLREILISSKV